MACLELLGFGWTCGRHRGAGGLREASQRGLWRLLPWSFLRLLGLAGVVWTFMLFGITWSADIAAYAFGNSLGGPKLWPRFSPNKTWSGFAGGLLAAMGVGAIMSALPWFDLNIWAALTIGLVGGLATMAGDLWESMLKRHFGVKDSGDLIPGHGGLLDRVDGLMFAVIAIAGARLINHLGWGH